MIYQGGVYTEDKMPSNTTKKYKQVDPITHILVRPDMYCGSTKPRESDEYVASNDFSIYKKNIL